MGDWYLFFVRVNMEKKSKNRLAWILVVVMIVLAGLVFLANYFDLLNLSYLKFYLRGHGDVLKTVRRDLDVFNSGDKNKIDFLVYTGQYLENDISREPDDLIGFFYKNCNISLDDIDDEFASFKIGSRDISDIGLKINDLIDKNIGQGKDFADIIKDHYIRSPQKSEIVHLRYALDGFGNIKINYNDFSFKDAVYGGLLSAYSELSKNVFNLEDGGDLND